MEDRAMLGSNPSDHGVLPRMPVWPYGQPVFPLLYILEENQSDKSRGRGGWPPRFNATLI